MHVSLILFCLQVKIMANDLHGLNYGISTFLQLLTLYSGDKPAGIPPLVINDHPSLQHRAVLIDVSQERIPTIVSFIFVSVHGIIE